MLDARHVREYLIQPALDILDMWSFAAENLLLGTAMVESQLTYLHQEPRGPALGICQMEPETHADCWTNFLDARKDLGAKVMEVAGRPTKTPRKPPDDWLIYNLRYAFALCRIKYWRVEAPLPDVHDYAALALYHKTYYNTAIGDTDPLHSEKLFQMVCEL